MAVELLSRKRIADLQKQQHSQEQQQQQQQQPQAQTIVNSLSGLNPIPLAELGNAIGLNNGFPNPFHSHPKTEPETEEQPMFESALNRSESEPAMVAMEDFNAMNGNTFVCRDADLYQRRRSSAKSMEQLFSPEMSPGNNDTGLFMGQPTSHPPSGVPGGGIGVPPTEVGVIDDRDDELFDDFNWDKLL